MSEGVKTKQLVIRASVLTMHVEQVEDEGHVWFRTFAFLHDELVAHGTITQGEDRYYHLAGIMIDVPLLADVSPPTNGPTRELPIQDEPTNGLPIQAEPW